MQTSLLVLAILFALSLVALLFAMVRRKLKSGIFGLGKVFAAALNVVILLVLVFYLHQQSTALDRLHNINIYTPDGVGQVVGMAHSRGSKPLWMFQYSGDASELADFYTDKDNRPGWELVKIERGKIQLRQEQAPVEMRIWMDPGVVAYLLTESK